ncbi:sensor histidine kinase [Lacunimicrobium album]
MQFPLRLQILLPFALLQLVTVTAIAVYASWLALAKVESDLTTRLQQISMSLKDTSFPLNQPILNRLASLTGAEMILWDESNRVALMTPGIIQPLTAEETGALAALDDDDDVKHERFRNSITVAGQHYIHHRMRYPGARQARAISILYPEESIEIARRNAMLPPLIVGSLLGFVTILTSFFIANSVSGRINSLQTQVRRVASGDFRPVPVPGRADEIQRLALSFNEMAMALEASRRVLRETERSRLLTQLISGLAHTLRNAITGARISVQLHQRRCQNPDNALERALAQMSLTEEQIKALLRITRGEQRTSVAGSVDQILSETLRLITPIVEHHRIAFESILTDSTCRVDDADAIRAAMVNLLMNAIEATGPEGSLRIISKTDDNYFTIDLGNTGPRITPELAERIFDPFFSTKQEGVGLGLSLARQSIEDCHGQLSLHTIDDMTVFRIRLPMTPSNRIPPSHTPITVSDLPTRKDLSREETL